jgi:hypothetical protein
MKFKTLSEVEDYYWKIISEDDLFEQIVESGAIELYPITSAL